MATPPATTAPRKSRAAALASTSGVVGLSALLIIGTGVAFLVGQSAGATVGVVEVFIDVEAAEYNGSAELVANPITIPFGPHCGGTTFDAHARVLTVTSQSVASTVKNVVLIHYTNFYGAFYNGYGSGGEQMIEAFLEEGGTVEVKAAYNEPTLLYTIAPGTATPIIPARAQESEPNHIVTTYTIASSGNYTPEFRYPFNTNMTVTETHRLEGTGGVRLDSSSPGFCM